MLLIIHWHILTLSYPHRFNKVERGYTGFTSSIRLSVRRSIHPSVRQSTRLWTKSFLLCIFHNTSWIHFIFAHLIKQLQRCVACEGYCKILEICNCDFVFLWHELWCESLVWVTLGQREVSQNAGVLVVLVFFLIFATSNTDSVASNLMSFLH